MRILFTILLMVAGISVFSQSVVPLRGDTIKIYKQGGFAELVLQNKTKDTAGIMVNLGNGQTAFMHFRKINDTTYILNKDTLVFHSGSGGSTDTTNLSARIDSVSGAIPTPFTTTHSGIVNPPGAFNSRVAIGADNTWRTFVTPGDTSGKWVVKIYESNDSVYFCKGNGSGGFTCTFAYLDATGGGGGDSNTFYTKYRSDTSRTNIYGSLGQKVANYAGASFLGYGTYAAKPTTGSGFYYAQDSARLAYINSGTLIWLTDPAGKTANIYFRGKGQPGDTSLVYGRDSTIWVAAIRDSGNFHHYINPDSSWTFYSAPSGGTFDSSSSQGGGFHTDPFNQGKYIQIKDSTSYATFKRLYKTLDSLKAINLKVGDSTQYATFQRLYKTMDSLNLVMLHKGDSAGVGYTTLARTRKVIDSLIAINNAVYPNETAVGDIFNVSNFQNSLTYFGTPNSAGSAAITTTSGYPIISATGINWLNTVTLLPDRPTMLSNHSDTLEVQIVSTATATVAGMGPALISTNTSSPLSVKCYIQTQTSGNGTITMTTHTGSPTLATASGCTNAVGDMLRFILSVNDSTITFSALNLTTGTSATCTTSYSTATNGNIMPNIGNWGYVIHGPSSFRILRQHIVSTAKRFPYLLAAGDSKFVGIGGTKFGTGPERTLGRSFSTTTYYSGAGSTAADFVKLKQEVLMFNPAYLYHGYSSNDLRFGATVTQTINNIITGIAPFRGTSTKVFLTVFPEDTVHNTTNPANHLTDIKNWMANPANQAAYGFTYVDCWTTLTGGSGNICVSPYIASDWIHLTDAGYAAVNPLLIAAIGANPIRRASPRTYSPTLVPIGDSLSTTYSVANRIGYILIADSNLNLVPSFYQQNGAQAGVSTTGAYIPAFNSAFGVNGTIGSNGPTSGFALYDRSINASFGAVYGLYSDRNLLRFNGNFLGRDFALIDSAGRWMFGNFVTGIQSVRPLAWVDIPASDGTAGHGAIIIRPGKKLTTSVPGMLDNDSSANHFYWTDKLGTQYQLDQQSGGGFTNPMTTVGDIIYGGASGAATRLPGNTTTTRKLYFSTGTGSAAQAPTLDVLQAGDVPIPTLQQIFTNERATHDGGIARLGKTDTISGRNAVGIRLDSLTSTVITSSFAYINTGDFEVQSPGGSASLFVSPVDISLSGGVNYSSLSFTASFTISTTVGSYSSAFITCGTLSGAGVITLPSSGAGGRTYKLVNANATSNAWTFAGATLRDAFGNTVTAFPNGYTYEIYFNGSSWELKGVSFTGGIPTGGVRGNTRTITSSTTILISDHFIDIDATSGNVTITIPAASDCFANGRGNEFIFSRSDASANTVTIQRNGTPGTDLINGASSFTMSTQYASKTIQAISASVFRQY